MFSKDKQIVYMPFDLSLYQNFSLFLKLQSLFICERGPLFTARRYGLPAAGLFPRPFYERKSPCRLAQRCAGTVSPDAVLLPENGSGVAFVANVASLDVTFSICWKVKIIYNFKIKKVCFFILRFYTFYAAG